MRCSFCASDLPDREPENVVLLDHLAKSRACGEQYGYLLENLRNSWTLNMSGA